VYLKPHGTFLLFYTRKNPALQDSPPAAGRYKRHLPFRRSAILPGRAFYAIGNSNGISYSTKKTCADTSHMSFLSFKFLFRIRFTSFQKSDPYLIQQVIYLAWFAHACDRQFQLHTRKLYKYQ